MSPEPNDCHLGAFSDAPLQTVNHPGCAVLVEGPHGCWVKTFQVLPVGEKHHTPVSSTLLMKPNKVPGSVSFGDASVCLGDLGRRVRIAYLPGEEILVVLGLVLRIGEAEDKFGKSNGVLLDLGKCDPRG